MKRIIALMRKELLLVFRDRTALLLMFAAPIALALVLTFAFGRVSGGNSASINLIPLVVVNQDKGELGARFVQVLRSPELSSLITVSESQDAEISRQAVDADQYAGAIVIPETLSECLQQGQDGCATMTLYSNPARPIALGVVKGIIDSFIQRASAASLAARVTMLQLEASGKVTGQDAAQVFSTAAGQAAEYAATHSVMTLDIRAGGAEEEKPFDFLGYYVPATAVLFLMFALSSGSRSLHAERDHGTLTRLLAAPITRTDIIIGKVLGVVAVGVAQMAILVLFSRFVLGVRWGNPIGVALHVLLTVLAISALGLLIGSLARSQQQADAVSMMVTMILAAIGGSFAVRATYPVWLKNLSLIGPNAWALDGFQKLAAGAGIEQLLPQYLALTGMAAVFLAAAVWGMRRTLR